MPRLLCIKASPRPESFSSRASQAFIESLTGANPGWEAEVLDLFSADLPVFDAPAAHAKYAVMSGSAPSGPDEEAWKRIIETVEHFKSADAYLLACPMWNFGIPYRLKHYLDVIVQPGLTFSFSPDTGYEGLVTGRPAVLVLARGSAYNTPETQGLDMQRPYLEGVFRFIGFSDVRTIVVEPTLAGGADVAKDALEKAKRELGSIAGSWTRDQ
jgi:FMN-dependent NADH-azoreductase